MMKYHVYYLLSPVSEGSMPIHGLVQISETHEMAKYFRAIGCEAYARMEYEHTLTKEEVLSFNLVYSPGESRAITLATFTDDIGRRENESK